MAYLDLFYLNICYITNLGFVALEEVHMACSMFGEYYDASCDWSPATFGSYR